MGTFFRRKARALIVLSALTASIIRCKRQKDTAYAARRLRETIEYLGPTYIKLGQILSTRPDILPEVYRKELSKLQENVPAVPFSELAHLIKRKKEIKEVETIPLSSASIAQVHKAKLTDGRQIVLKIKKPHVWEKLHEDIGIILTFAKMLEKTTRLIKNFKPVKIVKEFEYRTKSELDFISELQAMETIRENLKGEHIIIPKTFESLSDNDVIVMEYVKGTSIEAYTFRDEATAKEFTHRAVRLATVMIFRDGFFHADPHPGNIYVGKKNTPLYFDFGRVGKLEHDLRQKLIFLFENLFKRNTEEVLTRLINLADNDDGDEEAFREHATEYIRAWYGKPINQQSLCGMINQVLHEGAKAGYSFNKDIVLTVMTLFSLEGMVLRVYPKFSYEHVVKTTVFEIVADEFSYIEMAKQMAAQVPREELLSLPQMFFAFADNVLRYSEKLSLPEKKSPFARMYAYILLFFITAAAGVIFTVVPKQIVSIELSTIFSILALGTFFLAIYHAKNL